MSEEKKVRFTVIDGIVALVIVAVLAFVVVSFAGKKAEPEPTTTTTAKEEKPEKYYLTFYVEEVPDFAAECIKVKDLATDDTKHIPLGKIVDLEVGEAAVYTTDSEGNVVKSGKEGYNSLMIKTETEANDFEHGVSIWGQPYVIGTSMTMYAGDAKVYGRLYSIEKKATKKTGTKANTTTKTNTAASAN